MLKLKFTLIFIFLLILKGYTQEDYQTLITQEWRVSEIKGAGMDLEMLTEEEKELLEELYSTSSLNFKEDKTFVFLLMEETTTGTWSVDEENKTLITVEDNGNESILGIEELNKDKFVIIGGEDDEEVTMTLVPIQ